MSRLRAFVHRLWMAVLVLAAAISAVIAADAGVAAESGSRAGPRASSPVATTTSPSASPSASASATATAPAPVLRSSVQVLSLAASDAPGGFRKVWVYRPAVADSADVPVVYFLHGLPGGYLDIANIGGKSLLDRLIASGTVAPFVLVVPDGNSSRAADPEWANAPARSQQLEDFVVGSLIDTVEGPDVRDREHRFLTGFSMGGYGAMNIALHHPGLYGAVASIAGYFDTDDESGIFGGDHTTLAANSPDHETAGASALQIMLADGQDDTLPVTRGETQRFAALLRDRGLTPYVDIEPGGHDSDYLAHELPRVLQFLVPPAG